MIYDLHTHTMFSDGILTPRELILRALENRVTALAITDHDTVDAYRDLDVNGNGIQLVPGIEFSTQWENTGVHVLGLNVELGSDALEIGVQLQTDARLDRARSIGQALKKMGVEDAFSGAMGMSAGSYVGRPHFAQYLVSIGKVKSIQAAFKKYLGDGKAGDIKQHWAEFPQVIQWIRDANGIPVLAHPLKYKLTRSKLKRLLDSFIQAGGLGMEVVSGQQTPQQTAEMARLCEQKILLASCGSDFHEPGKHWGELGAFAPLPDYLTPVWDRF
jgi:predicted metal-dependent phosphoesterase TrpH